MMTLVLRVSGAAFLALAAAPTRAAENDTQVWTVAQASVGLGEKAVLLMDIHYRYADDASRLGQNQIRATLGYRLNATTILGQGYVYVRTDPGSGGAIVREHRPFQQLNFRLAGNGQGLTILGRSRVEERFVEARSGMSLRVRQQFRATVPVTRGIYGVATAEVMVNLNSVGWGPQRGFDQSRLMAGLGTAIAKGVQIEAGYMHNHVARAGREDRVNHNVSLSLALIR